MVCRWGALNCGKVFRSAIAVFPSGWRRGTESWRDSEVSLISPWVLFLSECTAFSSLFKCRVLNAFALFKVTPNDPFRCYRLMLLVSLMSRCLICSSCWKLSSGRRKNSNKHPNTHRWTQQACVFECPDSVSCESAVLLLWSCDEGHHDTHWYCTFSHELHESTCDL